MTILVTGGAGRCGRALAARPGVIALPHAALDIREPDQIAARLDEHRPALVINAAAMTNVDRCESEPTTALEVNGAGAGEVARACRDRDIPLIHLSTDYVFGGAETRPYREDDPRAPLGMYGATKAEGEDEVLAAGGTVVRTSWLFAAHAHGFVQRILARLAAEASIEVVADRHGCPTWVEDLADALLALGALGPPPGVFHYAGEPATTWFDFAGAIADAAGLDRARILPISYRDLGTPIARPPWSVLDTSKIRALGIAPRPWATGLARVIGGA